MTERILTRKRILGLLDNGGKTIQKLHAELGLAYEPLIESLKSMRDEGAVVTGYGSWWTPHWLEKYEALRLEQEAA